MSEQYQKMEVIGDGSYGTVYRAIHVETGAIFAIKKIKTRASKEGVQQSGIDEIRALRVFFPTIRVMI